MQVEPVVGEGCGTYRDSDREAPAEQQPAHDVARQSVDEDGADGHGREDEWEGHSNECGVGETTGQCLHETKQDERERGDPHRYEGRSVPAAVPMPVGSSQGGWLTPDAHEAGDLFDDAMTGEILDRGPLRDRYGTVGIGNPDSRSYYPATIGRCGLSSTSSSAPSSVSSSAVANKGETTEAR